MKLHTQPCVDCGKELPHPLLRCGGCKEVKTYTVHATCTNCSWFGPRFIPRGQAIEDTACSSCKVKKLIQQPWWTA